VTPLADLGLPTRNTTTLGEAFVVRATPLRLVRR
jgi:hypothetical protein